MNSKRLASVLCASTFLGLLAVLVGSSHSAPAKNDPCVGCGLEKIMVPSATGNADFDRANAQWAANAAAQVRQRAHARSAAKQRAHNAAWHGTDIKTKVTETDEGKIALHDAVGLCFDADPRAPAARDPAIKQAIAAGGGVNLRHIGYYGTIESVTPNEGGWLAVVNVSPRLEGLWSTTFRLTEEWQIGKDGSMQNLSCKPHPDGRNLLMRD